MTTDGQAQALLRLMTWLSPAFPVGGFAYSGGLETAVREGIVTTTSDLRDWLETSLRHGAARNDAILLTEAWNAGADAPRLVELTDLACALTGSSERYLEVTAQGGAFLEAAAPWLSETPFPPARTIPYAVAVGCVAAENGVALHDTLLAWLHALVSQSVSAAIRLGVMGQREAMALLSAMEPTITDVARWASASSLDDLGSAAVLADVMSARHETLGSRLFRS